MDDESNMSEPNRLLIDESVSSSAPASPSCSTTANNASFKMATAAEKTPAKRKANRITEFIEDKTLRIRSYFRRRHVPLKKAFEMDLQCGTQTLLVQISEDIDECLYYGHDKLAQLFLSHSGISVMNVNDFIAEEKHKLGKIVAEDPDILEALGKKRRKSTVRSFDEDDDEFSPTVKEKERKAREKRREVAKRVQEGDYLSNITERTKAFNSRKDSCIFKTKDMDRVCGTKSFIVIINMDHEAAYYHGDPTLVHKFFTTGISRSLMDSSFNIRPFDPEELDFNACSAPLCLVTRNTLSRWRIAAIKMYRFPKDLPMTLYLCPENDLERWLAELDIDPAQVNMPKLAVCSLHFRDGFPSDNYPLPTELLSEKLPELPEKPQFFKGKRSDDPLDDDMSVDSDGTHDDGLTELVLKQPRKSLKERVKLAAKARRKRRQWIPSVDYNDKMSIEIRRKKLSHDGLFGSRIQCRFCSVKIIGTKQYFRHVRKTHLNRISKKCSPLDLQSIVAQETITPVTNRKEKRIKGAPVLLSPDEKLGLLSVLYPKGSRAKTMNPRKKYACAVCKSHYDLYGLFYHMKNVHHGLLCCYCTKLFKKVRDLEVHIKNVHRVPMRYYYSAKQFMSISGLKYSLVCSVCSDVVGPKDLDKHPCKLTTKKHFDCPYNCGRNFSSQNLLDIHICNGWCKEMRIPSECTNENSRKLYKALTGKDADLNLFEPAMQPSSSQALDSHKPPTKKPKYFSVHDRKVLDMFALPDKKLSPSELTDELPSSGSIFHSFKARGLSASLKKEIRENGSTWRSNVEKSDTLHNKGEEGLEIIRAGKNFCINHQHSSPEDQEQQQQQQRVNYVDYGIKSYEPPLPLSTSPQRVRKPNRRFGPKVPLSQKEAMENKENTEEETSAALITTSLKISIKKESKAERIARAVKEIPANLEKLKVLLDHFAESCLFCQQSHNVNVDAVFLLSHLLIIHDRQVVKKFLGEDAQDSIFRIKTYLRDSKVKEVIFSYDFSLDRVFHCCYCPDNSSTSYTQLFSHLMNEHQSKVLTCHICQNIFLNYGSFRSHVCFGPPSGPDQPLRAKFSCVVCQKQDLSTFLDFQRHVRHHHNTCEICFTVCGDQEELYTHCLAHSQELMCMKCFLTYDDHPSFRKHLFYKHEDEHQLCQSCHQKTWPHVYHFCIQPNSAICEVCDANFDNFKKYRVHLRTHTGATPHVCSIRACKKSYVSKQLLLKHYIRRHPDMRANASTQLESRRNAKFLQKMGASCLQHVELCKEIILGLVDIMIPYEDVKEDIEENKGSDGPKEASDAREPSPDAKDDVEMSEPQAKEEEEEFDPIASAVASIMGPDGIFDIKKSPVKAPAPIEPIMPPLIPVVKPAVSSGNTSLLKPQIKPVDPLKMILDQEAGKANVLPPPSDILPPSSFHDIIKGRTFDDKDDDETVKENEDDQKPPEAGEDVQNVNPVLGGIWNQDLMFVSNSDEKVVADTERKTTGCKVMKPRYQIEDQKRSGGVITNMGLKSLPITKSGWEVLLSESSGSDNEASEVGPKKPKIKAKSVCDKRTAIRDHDYCYAAFMMSKEEPPKEDLSEMDKILSNVALGALDNSFSLPKNKRDKKNKKDKKKKKKKRKKHKKKDDTKDNNSSSSSDSEAEIDVTTPGGASESSKKVLKRRLSKAKYHTPGTSQGVTATAARPHFSSSEAEDDDLTSGGELASSDLDTDFSADENPKSSKRAPKPTPKAAAFAETQKFMSNNFVDVVNNDESEMMDIDEPAPVTTPSLKLKIKLPQTPTSATPKSSHLSIKINSKLSSSSKKRGHKRKKSEKSKDKGKVSSTASFMSKKMRESLALNRASSSSDSSEELSDYEESSEAKSYVQPYGNGTMSGSFGLASNLAPEADTKLYCVCQSPHDDVSEMIACDAPDCKIEWFHFECIGIISPPEGHWYCPECTKRYNIRVTY